LSTLLSTLLTTLLTTLLGLLRLLRQRLAHHLTLHECLDQRALLGIHLTTLAALATLSTVHACASLSVCDLPLTCLRLELREPPLELAEPFDVNVVGHQSSFRGIACSPGHHSWSCAS